MPKEDVYSNCIVFRLSFFFLIHSNTLFTGIFKSLLPSDHLKVANVFAPSLAYVILDAYFVMITGTLRVQETESFNKLYKSMRFFITLSLLVGSSLLLFGQNRLSGLWEGTITLDGIYSAKENRFQMLIQYKDGNLSGRSYIYLDNGEILEMKIHGQLFGDWSMSIYDVEFMPIGGSDLKPPFQRKYQLIYNTSVWETTLDGYWQEIRDEALDKKRQLGRITLKKLPQVAVKP